ncbi:MAG: hypothetical protein JWQ38_1117 [Flavipsychrobacter sp.]|nr:hypothetical protein [Flavipsychrobacter sp.]
MRSIIVLLSVFFIFSFPTTTFSKNKKKNVPEVKNNLKKEHLKGKVSSLLEMTYDVMDGKNKILHNQKKYYTEQGYIYLIDTYGKDSILFKQERYIYDKNNFLTGILDSDIINKKYFFLFKNDQFGNDTASAFFKSDTKGPELVSQSTRKFDKSGNVTEQCDYDEKKGFKSKTHSSYDSKNNLVALDVYAADNTIKEKYAYAYNADGNKIETINYDASGKFKYKFSYEYTDVDDKGNWRKFTRFQDGKAQLSTLRTIEYYP